VKVLALFDTGVDMTFLDHSVLESLGLEPEPGKASVYTFSTGLKPHTANYYRADIRIVYPEPSETDYGARNIVVVESELFLSNGIQAAIGRNVLRNCLFTYNGVLQTFGLTYGRQG
jgi:hypothetical protein